MITNSNPTHDQNEPPTDINDPRFCQDLLISAKSVDSKIIRVSAIRLWNSAELAEGLESGLLNWDRSVGCITHGTEIVGWVESNTGDADGTEYREFSDCREWSARLDEIGDKALEQEIPLVRNALKELLSDPVLAKNCLRGYLSVLIGERARRAKQRLGQ